jgi:hypothetical protein
MIAFTSRAVQLGVVAASLAWLAACGSMTDPARSVAIVEPADGATVSSPFKVRFGVRGMAVAPAGEVLADSGHHHLLINLDAVPAGESVPFTERHLHFGKGQTETDVTLPPGSYKLTAQFANGAHQSYGKPMSRTIAIIVK